MAAGALGSIIGQFDKHDRCLPRRPVRLALALAVAAGILTACAWDPPTIERTPREAAGTETSAKSRLAARKGAPQNGTAPSGAPGEKIDGPGTEMAALEVDLTNFKERLIGLDSDEINDLMGTPGLERAEPPALIWQYRHQVCTVDIFMFDDGGGATVDHVEVRPTSGGSVNEKECFTALLRNVPQAGASAKAPGGQQVAPSPSSPVGRRPIPSAAPASGPAQTPSSSRPPVPSTAAPSAAPVIPAARPPSAAPSAIPEGEEGPPPADTDVDFDFGAPPAPPGAAPPAAQSRLPSAAPSSEAVPTLPPEFSDEIAPNTTPDAKPPGPPPGPTGSLDGIDIPSSAAARDIDEFGDPSASAPPAKPAAAAPPAKPAPLAAVAPSPTPSPAPSIAAPALPTPPAPSVAAVPTPSPAAPSTAPAPLSPRAPTATAAAQPKGATKGAAKGAAHPVEEIDDEDLPPDLLGRREDDPSHNNEDLVE